MVAPGKQQQRVQRQRQGYPGREAGLLALCVVTVERCKMHKAEPRFCRKARKIRLFSA
jgi:hypothetical protein